MFLIERRHEAVHRRDIFDRVWNDVVVSDSALSQAIRTVRRTLGGDPRESLLDLRVSRAIVFGGAGRIEILVDLLNVLNDTAEESVATDNLFSANFGQPTAFVDPRRAMIGVRVNLGR